MDLLLRNLLDRNGALYPDREVTWRDLEERTNRVANFLHAQGVRRGDRIGVLHRNCAEFIAIYLAASKLGAVFAPYNYWFRANELEHVIGDSDPTVLLFGGEFEDIVVEATGAIAVTTMTKISVSLTDDQKTGSWIIRLRLASPVKEKFCAYGPSSSRSVKPR